MISRRALVLTTLLIAAAAVADGATLRAAEPILIGEINSYTRLPTFTEPYRKGWQLAVEEINAKGGVLGRELRVISRDDSGKPGDAVRIAEELVDKEKVVLIAGTFFSNIGLAVADFARRNKVLFIAAEPLSDALTWSEGNRYTFRLRPSTYMQAAMLAEEAAKLPAVRWVTVAPDHEYGKSAVATFKALLSSMRPDVEWVGEQWPPLFKMDESAIVRALDRDEPDAIFNVTFGGDLAKIVRAGKLQGLFDGREVVSLLTGEPEYLDPLKDEAPEGWIVTGYPWYAIDTEAHSAFVEAYRNRHGDDPRTGSIIGYNTFKSIAAAIETAGSTDTEALIDAMEGLSLETPVGPITFRAIDHQSTMGAYIGRTGIEDGKGVMVDWRYADGANYLPSDDDVRAMRPAE
jgi:branched-chain amino acid transport system substrate-binding protein